MLISITWFQCPEHECKANPNGPNANWLVGWLFKTGYYKNWPYPEEINDAEAMKKRLRTTPGILTLDVSDALIAMWVSSYLMEILTNDFHVRSERRLDEAHRDCNTILDWLNSYTQNLEQTRDCLKGAVADLKRTRVLPGLGRKEIGDVRRNLENELNNLNFTLDACRNPFRKNYPPES